MSYVATFRGGPWDGETRTVASVAPSRIVFPGELEQRAQPRAWDGKPLARRPYAVYENREHDAGDDGTVTYHYERTVR